MPVDGGAHGVGLAEDVVEDLERQRARRSRRRGPRRGSAAGRSRPGRGRAGGGGSTAARPSTARGASASCRKNIFSPGIAGDPGRSRTRGRGRGSCPGRARAPGGRRGARPPRTPPRCRRAGPRPAPRRRSAGRARRPASARRVQLLGEPVGVARRRRGRPRSTPARCRCPARAITSNLCSARRRFAASAVGVGRVEVAERLVEVDRQAEVGAAQPDLARRHRARRRGRARRSRRRRSPRRRRRRACPPACRTGTPWRWRCGRSAAHGGPPGGRPGARSPTSSCEVAEHPGGVRAASPVNSAQRVGGLVHRHPPAVERRGSRVARARPRSSAVSQRPVDDLGDPQPRVAAARRAAGRPGWSAMPVGVACTRPSAAASGVADRVGRGGVRAAGAEARVEPATSARARAGVDVEHVDVAGPAGEQGVRRGGAGTARAEQDDPVRARRRAGPVRRPRAKPGPVGVVPDRASAGRTPPC